MSNDVNNDLYRDPVIKSIISVSETFNLEQSDLEHRGKSFLDEKTLRLAGIRRVSDDIGHQILGKDGRQKDVVYQGLAIPHFDLSALPDNYDVAEWMIRRDIPDYEKDGAGNLREKRKYIKPALSINRLYIAPMIPLELLKQKKGVFVFTEGEMKALALARVATNDFESADWSFIPIGISGVDNFKARRKADTPDGERLVSTEAVDFDKLNLRGSKAFICFDSDLQEKPAVKAARFRLMRFLREAGAKVFTIDFPQLFEGTATKGIDDYLGAIEQNHGTHTAIETFLELLETAEKPRKTISPMAGDFKLFENGEGTPGVYFDNEKGESFRVCSPLRIVAETHTECGENYCRLLEWRDSQNRLHRWAMPVEYLHSAGAEIAKHLAANGLEIMPSRRHHEKLAFYIASAPVEKNFISTDKIGLHGKCFVLPDKTFGSSGSENEIIYQAEFQNHHNFRTSGTLSEWQEEISKYCRNNSRLLFSASAAFAGPLLPILQMQGGGFHFRGATSTGKTTALLVAGSVCGGGGEHGFMQTWKATANGLEIIAARHNHSLLCLDEMDLCDSSIVGDVTYMLSNGNGKIRMTKQLQAGHSLSWNLIFLSNGEQKLTDKIAEGGRTIKGGQEIRLCDIEADTGIYGLFEDTHGFASGQAFSDYLRASASSYYGAPLRSYLESLTGANFEEIRATWQNFKTTYIESVLPDSEKTPTEVFRVAARFALIAFAGELATTADVTGWQEGEATEAAKTIFRQWMNGREGSGQTDIERGIRQVRKYIQNYEQSRFQKYWESDDNITDERTINERVGFVKKNKLNNEREFIIFPDSFKEICKGCDAFAIAREMKERGILIPDGKGNLAKPVNINGDRQRYYVITEKIFAFDDEPEQAKTKAANV